MQSHVKYTISILSQRLYLLNQLYKQRLNVSGLTQVCMALAAAKFQYVLPALTVQLSADDLHKVDAVFIKAHRWQLTSHTPNTADLIEQYDKCLFQAVLNPIHCLHNILPPQRKICMDVIWQRKVMDASCHWQKLNCLKIVFLCIGCINMFELKCDLHVWRGLI